MPMTAGRYKLGGSQSFGLIVPLWGYPKGS